MSDLPVCILAAGTAVPNSIFPCDAFIKLQTDAAEFATSKLNPKDSKDQQRIAGIKKKLMQIMLNE
jgi:hypothetical protein